MEEEEEVETLVPAVSSSLVDKIVAMEQVPTQLLEDLRLEAKNASYICENSTSPEAEGEATVSELIVGSEGRGEEKVESTAVSTESTTSGTPSVEEEPNSSAKGEAAAV